VEYQLWQGILPGNIFAMKIAIYADSAKIPFTSSPALYAAPAQVNVLGESPSLP
jgi:hypothetical protein